MKKQLRLLFFGELYWFFARLVKRVVNTFHSHLKSKSKSKNKVNKSATIILWKISGLDHLSKLDT